MAEITVLDELEKADELRQRGVISQQEFDAFKAKLLGSSEGAGVAVSASPPPPPAAPPPPPPPPRAAPQVPGGFEREGLGGAFTRATEAASGAVSNPGGFYQEHKKGVDEAAGAGLIAGWLDILPGRWRVHGGIIFGLIVGFLLVVIGFALFNVGKVPAPYTGVASARVTALNLSTSPSGTNGQTVTSCDPTATFAVAGKAYSVTRTSSQSPCPVSVGSIVTVVYQPSDPAIAMMKPSRVPSIIPWALIVIGFLAIIGSIIRFFTRAAEVAGGAVLLYKGRKKDKENKED